MLPSPAGILKVPHGRPSTHRGVSRVILRQISAQVPASIRRVTLETVGDGLAEAQVRGTRSYSVWVTVTERGALALDANSLPCVPPIESPLSLGIRVEP